MNSAVKVTTIALDESDELAIRMIQTHLRVSDSIRRGPIPKREAISWAVRKVAQEIEDALALEELNTADSKL